MTGPDFSVVIPTYNRPRALSRCLEALDRLDYPKDRFEVVVVDDGGTAPLDDLVGSFRDRLRIALLRQPNAGPGEARNAGVHAASGTHVVFTDDDCTPQPDWLTALAARVAARADAAVGGRTRNALTDNLYAAASQLLIEFLCDYYNDPRQGGAFGTTSNLAVPREAFLAMSGFDTRFPQAAGEDRELIDRWRATEQPFVYAPEVVVWHHHDLRLGSFLRQHRNYGGAAFHFHQIRTARASEAMGVEPASFYLGLAAYPFASEPLPRATALSLLITLTQVANAYGYFREKLSVPASPKRYVEARAPNTD